MRVRSSVRLAAGALVLAGTAVPLVACDRPEATGVPCGLVVDTTSFFANTNVRDKIQSYVPRYLDGCATVGFGVVTGVSGATDCRHPLLRLNPTSADNPNGNPKTAEGIRAARRRAAVAVLWQLAQCAQKEKRTRTGSDILGALDLIARDSSEYGRLSKILIISDMIENSPRLNLYKADIRTRGERDQIIRRLQEDRALPELKGTKISILGFGLLATKDPSRLIELRELWDEVFTASGTTGATYL